jgi:ADP-ribose pyrophosphatase YjhB (NUDIX family)
MQVKCCPIILEQTHRDFVEAWKAGAEFGLHAYLRHEVELPAEPKRLSDDEYAAMQFGSTYACADIVVVTKAPNGLFGVLLSKRTKGKPFAGKWWVYGGKMGAGELPEDTARIRAAKECGIDVRPQVLLGVYHTIAPDFMCSTIQSCYAAFVDYEKLMGAHVDEDHSAVSLFSMAELDGLPEHEKAWYPMYVAQRVISAASEIF